MSEFPNENNLPKITLAQEAAVIKDPVVAQQKLEDLATRLNEADEDETKEIVTGLGELGVRCQQIQLPTADLLLKKLDEPDSPRLEIIKALSEKAGQIHLPFTLNEQLSEESKEKLVKIVKILTEIIRSPDAPAEIKAGAIKNIARFAPCTGLGENIKNSLKCVIDNEDLANMDLALKEIVWLAEPGDPDIIRALHQKVENGFANASEIEKINVIQEIEKVGDQSFMPFLEDMAHDKNTIVKQNVLLAIKAINERETNEEVKNQ